MARIRSCSAPTPAVPAGAGFEKAERVLEAAIRQVGEESLEGITLAVFGQKWLDRRELDGRHRSIRQDRSQWREHIATAPFFDRPLRSVRRKDVKLWVDALAEKEAVQAITTKEGTTKKRTGRTLSRSSVQHSVNLLRACLHEAVDQEVIRENPAAGVRVRMRPTPIKQGWSFLTLAEIEALLACAKIPERHRLLYTVAIHTGLRKGELWGLRWGDVHLRDERPRIVVRHSYDNTTKSGRIHEVPLVLPARQALEQHRRSLGAIPFPSTLVWPSADGGCHHESYTAQWQRHRGKVLDRHVRFHDLRHTTASHLVMGSWRRTWTLDEVGELLGHSPIIVTQRYAHLAPSRPRGRPSRWTTTSGAATSNSAARPAILVRLAMISTRPEVGMNRDRFERYVPYRLDESAVKDVRLELRRVEDDEAREVTLQDVLLGVLRGGWTMTDALPGTRVVVNGAECELKGALYAVGLIRDTMNLEHPSHIAEATWFYVETDRVLDDPHYSHHFFLDDGRKCVGLVSLSEVPGAAPENVLRRADTDGVWRDQAVYSEARAFAAYMRFRREVDHGKLWAIAGCLEDLATIGVDRPTVGMVEHFDSLVTANATTRAMAGVASQLRRITWLLAILVLLTAWLAWRA